MFYIIYTMAVTKLIEITLMDGTRKTITIGQIQSMSCETNKFLIELKDGTHLHLTQQSYRECVPLYSLMLKGKFLY
jgi:hypothetical protein